MQNIRDFAPYFRNGLLFLPEKTVELLISAGLDPAIARAATRGLALDDDRALIAQISNKLERVLGKLAEDSVAFEALASAEARFMLSGWPAAQR